MPRRTISAIALLTIGISLVSPADLAVAQDGAPTNDYWWPNRLSLDPLRQASRDSIHWARTSTMRRSLKLSTWMCSRRISKS